MSEVPHFVLYEHAAGYALMKIKEFDDAGLILQEVRSLEKSIFKISSLISRGTSLC